MKKGYWKCYDIDEYITVCARSKKDALDWAKKERITDEEYLNSLPVKVDMKSQYMCYMAEDMPTKRHKPCANDTWEGEPAVIISLKQTIRYYIRKNRPKEPFVICYSEY